MRVIRRYLEDVYGNLATVYHRTRVTDLINKVYTLGFKPGEGDMYGKGFYSTYRLQSQERESMTSTYGNIIVKFVVPVEYFLILDPEPYMKSPLCSKLRSIVDLADIRRNGKTEQNSTWVLDQMNYFNIFKDEGIRKKALSSKFYGKQYSSSLALNIAEYDSNLQKKINGMIFTGEQDGEILLSYNTEILVPVSYKMDGERDFSKVELNKEYFKQSLLAKAESPSEAYDNPRGMRRTSGNSIFAIEITSKGTFIEWQKGTWESGTWHDGTWEKGTWLNGTWEKGTWLAGTWEKGTWLNGTWEKGTWYGGTWLNGVWKNGTWLNGIWKGGTWKDGIWKGGTWLNGVWKGGFIYDPSKKGKYKSSWRWRGDYVYSPISPSEYFSEGVNETYNRKEMIPLSDSRRLIQIEVLYDGHRGWNLTWGNGRFKVVYGSVEEFSKILMKIQAKDNFSDPHSFRSMTYIQIAQEIANGSDRTIWVWEKNLKAIL